MVHPETNARCPKTGFFGALFAFSTAILFVFKFRLSATLFVLKKALICTAVQLMK